MSEREKTILFEYKKDCCGCTACFSICPVNAIKMVEDEEGFDYPAIDENKCIKCYKCLSICPIKRKISNK